MEKLFKKRANLGLVSYMLRGVDHEVEVGAFAEYHWDKDTGYLVRKAGVYTTGRYEGCDDPLVDAMNEALAVLDVDELGADKFLAVEAAVTHAADWWNKVMKAVIDFCVDDIRSRGFRRD